MIDLNLFLLIKILILSLFSIFVKADELLAKSKYFVGFFLLNLLLLFFSNKNKNRLDFNSIKPTGTATIEMLRGSFGNIVSFVGTAKIQTSSAFYFILFFKKKDRRQC